jgi:hypothetical protein
VKTRYNPKIKSKENMNGFSHSEKKGSRKNENEEEKKDLIHEADPRIRRIRAHSFDVDDSVKTNLFPLCEDFQAETTLPPIPEIVKKSQSEYQNHKGKDTPSKNSVKSESDSDEEEDELEEIDDVVELSKHTKRSSSQPAEKRLSVLDEVDEEVNELQ